LFFRHAVTDGGGPPAGKLHPATANTHAVAQYVGGPRRSHAVLACAGGEDHGTAGVFQSP